MIRACAGMAILLVLWCLPAHALDDGFGTRNQLTVSELSNITTESRVTIDVSSLSGISVNNTITGGAFSGMFAVVAVSQNTGHSSNVQNVANVTIGSLTIPGMR
jgi:hypothetical protein